MLRRCALWGAGMILALAGCTSTTSESAPATPGDGGASAQPPSAGGSAGTATVAEVGGPVDLGSAFNARQTGGLATQDGRHVRSNVLIRSGQLSALDAAGCASFSALGVRTVIDLRAATAVAAEPDVSCVTDNADYYNADLPKILPPDAANYLLTLDATEPVLPEIFARLGAEDGLPAVIHCVIGRDRASLVMAIVLLALGVADELVLTDFEQNQATDVDRAWMNGVMERITSSGGIDAYLLAHGVTDAQLAAVRAAALE